MAVSPGEGGALTHPQGAGDSHRIRAQLSRKGAMWSRLSVPGVLGRFSLLSSKFAMQLGGGWTADLDRAKVKARGRPLLLLRWKSRPCREGAGGPTVCPQALPVGPGGASTPSPPNSPRRGRNYCRLQKALGQSPHVIEITEVRFLNPMIWGLGASSFPTQILRHS